MIAHYMNVALRVLRRNLSFSFINIFGLALGIATCLMILLLVRYETNYDTMWEKKDRMYRVEQWLDNTGGNVLNSYLTSGAIKKAVDAYFPEEVEEYVRMYLRRATVKKDDKLFREKVFYTDPGIVSLLDLPVVDGVFAEALADTNSVAISENMAQKYFGTAPAVGETLHLNAGSIDKFYKVAAVFKELPDNSSFRMDFVTLLDDTEDERIGYLFKYPDRFAMWAYILLKDGVSIDTIKGRTAAMIDHHFPMAANQTSNFNKQSERVGLDFTALKDVHLKGRGNSYTMAPQGSKDTIMIFSVVAFVILAIACMNFINLTTAKSTQRAREVALRKTMGAKRSQLITQFLGETFLLSLLALILSIGLLALMLPVFNSLVDKSLSLSMIDPVFALLAFALLLFITIAGGLYPAFILSSFKPGQILQSNKSRETKSSLRFRQALVLLQYGAASLLITATIIISWQARYALNVDLGFDQEKLITLMARGSFDTYSEKKMVKDRLSKVDGIIATSHTTVSPFYGSSVTDNYSVLGQPGAAQNIYLASADEDYFKTLRVDLLAGRHINTNSDADVYKEATQEEIDTQNDESRIDFATVINESARKKFGFASPQEALGHTITARHSNGIMMYAKIIGVVNDYSINGAKNGTRAEMVIYEKEYLHVLMLRYVGATQDVTQKLEQAWREIFPNIPFKPYYVEDFAYDEVEEDITLSRLLLGFSVLTVLVASLGLYGLASFTADRRTKEIGIRKVMGASVADIMKLLLWQFSKPIFYSNLVALPIALYGLHHYLSGFSLSLDIWVIIPVAAAVLVVSLLVAALTTVWHILAVARRNPVHALQYE